MKEKVKTILQSLYEIPLFLFGYQSVDVWVELLQYVIEHCVKCPECHGIRLSFEASLKSCLHLACGLFRECDDEDFIRRDMMFFDHYPYPLDKKMCLAASGSRQDKHRAVRYDGRPVLLPV